MKTSVFKKYSWIFPVMIMVLFPACEEDEPLPEPGNPDDLAFEGSWIGNTSQTKILWLEVVNEDGWAKIIKCRLGLVDVEDYKVLNLADDRGMARIIDGSFNFDLPDGGNISGLFESEDACNGTFSVFNAQDNALRQHNFTIISDTTQISGNALTRTKFSVDGTEYSYIQDFSVFYPSTNNVITDTGIIAGTAFNRIKNSEEGQPLILIRAGHFDSINQLLTAFSVGEKNYSVNAANGFEIVYYDPTYFYVPWSTSVDSATQTGSRFEITRFEEIMTGPEEDYRLFKFTAAFNCYVYREWGSYKVIENGFYMGYVDTRLQ